MWPALVAQMVKNPPAVRETWVQSLGREDPLEKGKATHSSILSWNYTVHVVAKNRTQQSNFHLAMVFLFLEIKIESLLEDPLCTKR